MSVWSFSRLSVCLIFPAFICLSDLSCVYLSVWIFLSVWSSSACLSGLPTPVYLSDLSTPVCFFDFPTPVCFSDLKESVCLSVWPFSTCLSVWSSFSCLSVWSFTGLYVWFTLPAPVCLSVCVSNLPHLTVWPFPRLFDLPAPVCLTFLHLSVWLTFSAPVYLTLPAPVCLSDLSRACLTVWYFSR